MSSTDNTEPKVEETKGAETKVEDTKEASPYNFHGLGKSTTCA